MSYEREFDDQADNPYSSPHTDDLPAVDKETRQWALVLHLSVFAGVLIPLAGFLAPILIWQIKKDDLPGIDAHGREVVNWMISEVIYGFLFFLLAFFLIGIPLLIILGIVGIVFPIIGAIKANDGILWRYPMSIRIL